MKSKIEEFIPNWSDGNICDWEITSLEKYYSFLKDKSEAFQHLWMSLIIVQYLSLLHFIAHKDQNYYVKAFSLLQKAILPMLEHYGNESLGKMLTLLLIDFSKYSQLSGVPKSIHQLYCEYEVSLKSTLQNCIPEINAITKFQSEDDLFEYLHNQSVSINKLKNLCE